MNFHSKNLLLDAEINIHYSKMLVKDKILSKCLTRTKEVFIMSVTSKEKIFTSMSINKEVKEWKKF